MGRTIPQRTLRIDRSDSQKGLQGYYWLFQTEQQLIILEGDSDRPSEHVINQKVPAPRAVVCAVAWNCGAPWRYIDLTYWERIPMLRDRRENDRWNSQSSGKSVYVLGLGAAELRGNLARGQIARYPWLAQVDTLQPIDPRLYWEKRERCAVPRAIHFDGIRRNRGIRMSLAPRDIW